MTKKFCRAKNKSCLKFSVVALSILVAGTALGNRVSAAEVHPTISTQDPVISDWLKNVASGLWSNLVTFVKDWLEKSTSQNKYDFRSKSTKETSDEVIVLKADSEYFVDMKNHPDRYYIETLGQKQIINNSNKFYPENYIRLNEVAKMIVNAYRYKVGYNLSWDNWLTDKTYFDTIMPKYYNTAYEMWLFDDLENFQDFERFVTYKDITKIMENLKKQYPNLVNLYYMDIQESNDNLKRWEVATMIFKTMMVDSDISYSYEDIAYSQYGKEIQLLQEYWVIDPAEKFYPEANVSRKDYILWLVKTHLKHLWEHLDFSELHNSLADLDYGSDYAPYILYAKNEWRVDYLVETVRWQDYLNLNSKLTKHEAFYIISKLTWAKFDYDIISADKEYITRWEVAELLCKVYKLDQETKNVSSTAKSYQNDSHIWRLIENIQSLMNWWKKLAFTS